MLPNKGLLSIDKKAVMNIKQIALNNFPTRARFSQVEAIIEALETYLINKGVEPGFHIEVDDV